MTSVAVRCRRQTRFPQVTSLFKRPHLPCTGRDAPGKAFRLYTESAFQALAPESVPEIKRCNLASVVLQLKVQHHQQEVSTYVVFCTPCTSCARAAAAAPRQIHHKRALHQACFRRTGARRGGRVGVRLPGPAAAFSAAAVPGAAVSSV